MKPMDMDLQFVAEALPAFVSEAHEQLDALEPQAAELPAVRVVALGHWRGRAHRVTNVLIVVSQRVAYMVRDRAPGAMQATVPDPVSQFTDTGEVGVVRDGCRLGDRVHGHREDSGELAQSLLRRCLAAGPAHAARVENARSGVAHVTSHSLTAARCRPSFHVDFAPTRLARRR